MKGLRLRGTEEALSSSLAKKVQATAQYLRLRLEIEHLSPEGWSDLLASVPMATSLILSYGDDGSGIHLTSSLTMMTFLASLVPSSELLGETSLEQAQVDGWMSFIWHSIDLPIHALRELDTSSDSEQVIGAIVAQVEESLLHLSRRLETNQYLVGSQFSIADLSLTLSLSDAPKPVLNSPYLSETSVLSQWQQQVRENMGLDA